jgi:phage terminase large subunit-like protein
VNQATAWIPIEWWDACEAEITDAGVKGLQCAAGLDLAQKIDLASFVIAFRRMLETPAETVEITEAADDGTPIVKPVQLNYEITLVPFFWIPEDTMRQHEKEDGVPYSQWVKDVPGFVATEGPTIDYSRIYSDITTKILPRFPMLKQGFIGYDPAFATDIAVQLRDRAGLKVVEILQNYTHMNEPGHVVEALIKAKRVRHDGNRVLRNHWEHVSIKRDDAGRIRPVRPKKRSKHIDGVVATLMANKGLMMMPPKKKSVGAFFV